MRDRRPCSKCGKVQCWKHCNNCGSDILWRPPALDKSIPYTGPKPLNLDGTPHDRCYTKSKGVGPGKPGELSYSQQLFQFLISSFNPRTGKFSKPLATLAQLKIAKYNARNAPKKIDFKDAFPKLCYICGEYYSVINKDCPVCYDLKELGVPSLKPGVIDKKHGEQALVEWAKENGERIPLYLLLRYRKQTDGKKESVRSVRKEKGRGWGWS